MTTVVNPGASEASVFNRSGVAILDLRSGASTNSASPTTITKYAGTTVVLASADVTDSENTYYQIGSGFDVGDVIEFYNLTDTSLGIAPNISDESGNNLIVSARAGGTIFRKVSSTGISVVGYASNASVTWFPVQSNNFV